MRLYWLNIRPKHKPKHKQLDWASLDQFTSPSTQWAFSHDYFHIELNFIFSRSKTIIDLELKSKTLENTQNLKSAQIASKSIDLFNWKEKKKKNVRSKQVPLVSAGDWSSHVSSLYYFCLYFSLVWVHILWFLVSSLWVLVF